MLWQNLSLCVFLCPTTTADGPQLQSLHYNLYLNFSSFGPWVLDPRLSKRKAS